MVLLLLQVKYQLYDMYFGCLVLRVLVFVFSLLGDLNMRDSEAKEAVMTVREHNSDDSFNLNDAYFQLGKPKELR